VIRGVPIVYNAARQELSCKGKTAPLKPIRGTIRLEILVDRTSVEIFGNGGRIYMPLAALPADEVGANNHSPLQLLATEGNARIQSLEVYRLRSAWQ
jgi:sucrose-6-phosphate hydrolase SacC (GH32 family)